MPYKDPEKQREYTRQRLARKRAEFFLDKVCVSCGSTDELELDHINPELKESHRIWSWSEDRRKIELAKCQVLCHSCHLTKTSAYRDLTQPHNDSRYISKGCRCEECTTSHNKAKREYRNRKRKAGLRYK